MSIRYQLARLRAALRRDRLDDQLREEVEQHIDMRRRQLIDDGMDPRDAAFEARRSFGNVMSVRERTRTMWSFPSIDTIVQDLRYGVRMMRRAPVLATVAIASLGIGIGAAAAVYGLADALVFRKLPVKAPDELVLFRWFSGPVSVFESLNGNSDRNDEGFSSTSFSRAAFDAARQELQPKADVFGFADLYRVNVAVDGRPDAVYGHVVSGNYYNALGVTASAGRLISDSDDRPDAPHVAVISYPYSQRMFGGANAVGRPLVLNGIAFTIIGVTPEGFKSPLQVSQLHDVAIPLAAYDAVDRRNLGGTPTFWWVLMMARLKPGVRAEHVQPDADVVVKRTTAASRPQLTPADLPRVRVESGARGQTEVRNGVREPLIAMALVVGIVLLVACANVANLLLARGRARVRELTIRVAIGAPRGRVVRQLVTEGVLLAILGGALGLLIAKSIAIALLPALAGSAALLNDQGIYWRVVGFTVVLAGGCSVLFGVLPALRSTNVRLASDLQDISRGAIGSRQRNALAGALVVVQVGLSMLLVTAAALLAYSARNLERVDPGFDPEGLLLFRVNPVQNGYDAQRVRNLQEAALARLRTLPGVLTATFASMTLLSGGADVTSARPAGTPVPTRGSTEAQQFAAEHQAWRLVIDDEFLRTMAIQLRAGRTPGPSDTATSQPVAVINESLAKRLFGTADVLGRRFAIGLDPKGPELEVIGVSADAKYTSVRRDAPPTFYVTYRQRQMFGTTFAIRTSGDPTQLAGPVRDVMRQLDPTLPLQNLYTQREQIRLSLGRERLFAQLAMLLGGVTLLLAAIGLYGLLAYSVARRTAEIGVRMALGAERSTVRWMIHKQSLVLVGIGLAIGIPSAVGGSRFIGSLLFGLSPTDPASIASAAAVMLAISIAAAFFPARRASRVDPVVALRAE